MKTRTPSFRHIAVADGDVIVVLDPKLSAATRAFVYAWNDVDETPQRVEQLVELVNRLFEEVAAMSDAGG